MAVPDDALAAHEKLVLNLHPHAWILVKPGALVVLTTVIGVVVASATDNAPLSILAAVAIVASVVFFLMRFAVWFTTFFVLTSDRVIYRAGVLTKRGIEIPLERINTVLVEQRLLERMIRVGDIEIESASKDGSQRFDDIRRPADVQKEIYVQMEANENRKFDRIGNNMAAQAAPAAPAPSIAEQINQLALLRDQGHITEVEFQAKKTELLNRL